MPSKAKRPVPASRTEAPPNLESGLPAADQAGPARAVLHLPPLEPAPASGYWQRHVDVRLRHDEACAARRLLEALQRAGARLAHPERSVRSLGDVVRWIFQQIG